MSRKIQSLYDWCVENNRMDILEEWNTEKNGDLTPHDVRPKSAKRIWWIHPYDDPETGKHYEFEWETQVYNRTNGSGCPYLRKGNFRKKWPEVDENGRMTTNPNLRLRKSLNYTESLSVSHPELAKEWHPTKNGDLTPDDITEGCNRRVWWQMPYEDPKTGRHFDFEWEARVKDRTWKHAGCPYLTGHKIWVGFNDLATVNPPLAQQWHPTRNGTLKPSDVTAYSSRKVWWLYKYTDPKTGKTFNYQWEESVANRSHKTNYVDPSAMFKNNLLYEVIYNSIHSEVEKIKQDVIEVLQKANIDEKIVKEVFQL